MPGTNQLSIDEQAAQMAERMLAKSESIPLGRDGAEGAEGGFTPQIGGKVIDADAQKSQAPAADAEGVAFGKSAKTGAAMSSEPGHQGPDGKTGRAITNEPGPQDGSPKPGGGMSEDEDNKKRARKAGQIGVGGGMNPGNLSETGDGGMRGRKAGKVGGMSKAETEEDEDEGDMEESYKKSESDVDADSLIKSLETLEAIAQGASAPTVEERKLALLGKLGEGSLSKSEMQELSDLMKGLDDDSENAESDEDALSKSESQSDNDGDQDMADDSDEMEKSFQNRWGQDQDLQEGYEVSSFLERHSQLTAAALDEVQNTLSKSLDAQRNRAQQFNTQLAKSLRGMAELAQRQETLIKSLTDRLETVENTPLPRKGVSNVSTLQKSMSGEVGGDQSLGRNEILNTLEDMAMKSDVAPCGEPLMRAVAMYENSGQLTKSLYSDVLNYRRENGQGLARH